MAYGIIKVDTVTFTNDGIDKSVSISGLAQNPTFSGNVTVTGTLSGVTVTGTTANFVSGAFSSQISGTTVTGTTASFISGVFTNISGGTHTITSGVFAAGNAASPSISFTSDPNTGIYSPGADQVAISTNGTGQVFLTSNGNLGLGTLNATNVAGKLHVRADGDEPKSLLLLQNRNAGGSAGGAINFVNGGVDLSDNRYSYIRGIVTGAGQNGNHIVFGTNATGQAASERLRITSDGKVGIGTSSPNERLSVDVNGTTNRAIEIYNSDTVLNNGEVVHALRFTQNDASAPNTTHASIETVTTGSLGFLNLVFKAKDNTEYMRIDTQGNVGVGTASPGKQLSIRSNSADVGLSIGAGSNSFNQDIDFLNSLDNMSGRIRYYPADGAMSFWSNFNERARIDSNGKVGIGTSSPGSILHLSSATGSASPTPTELRIESTTEANNWSAGLPWGRISFYSADTSGNGPKIDAAITASKQGITGGNSALDFWTDAGTGSGLEKRLTIVPTGDVGVGTASPGSLLDITESAVSQTPNVSSPLVVRRAGGVYVNLLSDNTTSGGILWGDTDSAQVGRVVYDHSDNSLAAYTAGAEKLRIDGSGRLLVGTSSDSGAHTLTLQGNSSGTTEPGVLSFRRNKALSNDDTIGLLEFSDNGNYIGASIQAVSDGTWLQGVTHPSRLVFSTTADGSSSPTERMRITNGGVILFNQKTVAPNASDGGFALSPSTNERMLASVGSTSTAAQNLFLFYNPNGLVGTIATDGSATAYNTSSDYRLKENVTPVTDGINRLQQLKPSRFNFIADPAKTVDGFLAHEVQTIVPEAITGEKDAVDDEGNPQYQGIDQSKIVPLVVAALQEAIAKIESLEARLTAAGL